MAERSTGQRTMIDTDDIGGRNREGKSVQEGDKDRKHRNKKKEKGQGEEQEQGQEQVQGQGQELTALSPTG
jgi:hypothetical protein